MPERSEPARPDDITEISRRAPPEVNPQETPSQVPARAREGAAAAAAQEPDHREAESESGAALPNAAQAAASAVASGKAIAVPGPDEDTVSSQGLYSRGEEISRGGMGRVSVAWDHNLQRWVAMKELLAAHRTSHEASAGFLREAFITGKLEHPGVVPVHHFGMTGDGVPFYTMKYISGQTLAEAIRALEDLPSRDALYGRFLLLQRVLQASQAVAFAHTLGIIHRDLKPTNIMLGEFGETVVLDWGAAKEGNQHTRSPVFPHAAAEPGRSAPDSTDGTTGIGAAPGARHRGGPELSPHAEQTIEIVGTPAYMPPEQALGHVDRVGPASDVFSLGATLYCVMTGQAPYMAESTRSVLAAAMTADYESPRRLASEVPPALETIILRAMALMPEDRYADAKALAADLERFLAGGLVQAHRYSLIGRALNWYSHHRLAVVTVLLLGIATSALAFLLGGVTLSQSLRGTLLWTADAQVQRAASQIDEWIEPAEGALGLVEDVAWRKETDQPSAQRALRTVVSSIPSVAMLHYASTDQNGARVDIGSEPAMGVPMHLDAQGRSWFEGALAAGGGLAVSEPFTDPRTGDPCVSLSRTAGEGPGAASDLVVFAAVNLVPLKEFVQPPKFPEGGAVLITSVDPTVPHPARWSTAKPVLLAGELDLPIFDTVRGNLAEQVVENLARGITPDNMFDPKQYIQQRSATGNAHSAVEVAALVEIGGRQYAVFTGPVGRIPWEVTALIPMASLVRPFMLAGGVVLRTLGLGLFCTAAGVALHYVFVWRPRRRSVPSAPVET